MSSPPGSGCAPVGVAVGAEQVADRVGERRRTRPASLTVDRVAPLELDLGREPVRRGDALARARTLAASTRSRASGEKLRTVAAKSASPG